MFFLVRRLIGNWRSATRAGLAYIVVAIAFCGLAVAGAINGNVAVAVLAVVATIFALGIAVIASKLSTPTGITAPPPTEAGGRSTTREAADFSTQRHNTAD